MDKAAVRSPLAGLQDRTRSSAYHPTSPRLPIDAGYAPEIDAKSVRAAQKTEQESGGDRVLIAEAASARRLDRRFLL
jgi:hypothetical protein